MKHVRRKFENVATGKFDRKQQTYERYNGFLGMYSDDGTKLVHVPTRPGYVYVRLVHDLSSTIVAYNDAVLAKWGLPVEVERVQGTKGMVWKVIGTDSQSVANITIAPGTPHLPAHGLQHSFNTSTTGTATGDDPVWIYKDQFVPLNVTPTEPPGFTLQVHADTYQFGREFHYFPNTTTVSFEGLVPDSSNDTRFMTVCLDTEANELVYITGSVVDTETVITNPFDYIPAPEDYNVIPLKAVMLVGSITYIQWQHLYDVRTFFQGGGIIDGSGITGRIAEWTDIDTLQASSLRKTGSGLLTIDSNAHGTLAIQPGGNTITLKGQASGNVSFEILNNSKVGTSTNTLSLAPTYGKMLQFNFSSDATRSLDLPTTNGQIVINNSIGELTLSAEDDYTLTIPGTGTAALKEIDNNFSEGQTIQPATDATAGLIVKGHSLTQSAALQEWKYSNGALLASIEADGDFTGQAGIFAQSVRVNGAAAIGSAPFVLKQISSNLGMFITDDNNPTAKQFNIGFDTGFNYALLSCIHQGTAYLPIVLQPAFGNIGIGYTSPSAKLHIGTPENALTGTVSTEMILETSSTGTPVEGFGNRILFNLESSTTEGQSAAAFEVAWATATHASRKAKVILKVWDTAERSALTLEADGSAADVYFEGGAGSGLPYGSCYGNEIGWTQASAVQDTWYVVSDSDMTDGHGGLNLITHDGSGKLTVTKAGRYLISYGITVECGTINKHIQSGIAVDGSVISDGIQHYETLSPSTQMTMASTAIISLAASSYVEIAVRTTDTGTPDISVDHLNISIVQVGG